MLNARPHGPSRSRLPLLADADASCIDPVTEARIERIARAEALARCGTIETYLDGEGRVTATVWSHGIYLLLDRDPLAGPLGRAEFIAQYIHRDDRNWLSAAPREVFAEATATELRYRLALPGDRIIHVRESTARVGRRESGDVMFTDIEEIDCIAASARAPAQASDAVQALYRDSAQSPAMHALIAAFDALRDCEQRRLTREMHDDFGQLLAAMKVDLALLERDAGQPGSKHVASLHELVDAMLTSVRRIISDLPPLAIEEHGLYGALGRLVCNFRKRHAIGIGLQTPAVPVQLPQSMELSVYRIIQEALNNIVRHANARNAEISLHRAGGNLVISIEDDGQGTSSAQLKKIGSYGLASMKERVAVLDGVLSISSDKGKGTRIRIVIPAPAAATTPAA